MPQRGCSRSLGRPALRSCSSTEQEPGHRGESVSDGRPIACASSSFVRLLGSGAFVACGPTRAREWVRLGSPVAVARRGVGLASRLCAAPRLAADISTLGESAFRGAKACGVCAAGIGRSAARSWWAVVGAECRRSRRSSESAASRRVGRRRQAVWEKWHRAGRRPICQLELWWPSRARSGALSSVGRAASRTIRPFFFR